MLEPKLSSVRHDAKYRAGRLARALITESEAANPRGQQVPPATAGTAPGAWHKEVLAPMQEQPTADIAQHQDTADGGIMGRLLVHDDHRPWSVEELIRDRDSSAGETRTP